MSFSFRQLQTFREVMRSGTVSEAARTLGRTQPAVSAMLASLEDELGFKLFERERKRLVAKPEAHYFLEEAEFVLSRLAQSARTMREIGGLERGKLQIACNPAASGFFMPKVVAHFLKERPDVQVSLMMRSSAIVEEWIASQQYDIGFAETPAQRRTINVENFEFESVCAVPADDPLASENFITPAHLDGKPMAALFEEHLTYVATRDRFRQEGASFNQRFELRTFLPALQLVEDRLCYCICDKITATSYSIYRPNDPALVFIPFRPSILFTMALLTPAQRPASLLAEAFCRVLRVELNKLGNESQ